MRDKPAVTYRLTAEVLETIERLHKQLGLSRQGVIEMAVREFSEKYPASEPAARGK
jgi:hypothetical protein